MATQQDSDAQKASGSDSSASRHTGMKRSRTAELLRRFLAFITFRGHSFIPANAVTYENAVRQFLENMQGVASRTYPQWLRALEDSLIEHGFDSEGTGSIASQLPVDEYYFVGLVALEASKIPAIYSRAETGALYFEIGNQIDGVVRRHDRVMSDMFFDVIGQLNLLRNAAADSMPYDSVVKAILIRLRLGGRETVTEILADIGLRQSLAEPFALHTQDWWKPFHEQFILYEPESPPGVAEELVKPDAAASQKPRRRRALHRAVSLFERKL